MPPDRRGGTVEEIRPMNVLIDINVPLDVFLAREPWLSNAQAVWAAHHRRAIVGHIAAHGLTNLFYIARRIVGFEKAREAVGLCLQTFEVIPVGRAELEHADSLGGNDIEDNLVLACAVGARLDAIVTRDPKGFPGSPIPVLSPAELLARLPRVEES
jgi:predicted nucleic acid-binding protein